MATLTQPETQTSSGMRRDSAGAPAPAPQPRGRRGMAFALMGVALAGLLAVGARHWWFNRSHVSTDDAQVDGHIIPILPKVGGFVMAVRVDENKQVKEGDTLVVLDDRDYRVRLAQADADLAVALASVNNRARVGQAEAQVEQAGQPLMSVVPLDDIWVTANLKETQTADVAPGDAADITVDAYPGRHFTGHVESISPATGAKFSLLPPDNATGNFTKVVQRIPVRVRLAGPNDPVHPLRPGMSVYVAIATR